MVSTIEELASSILLGIGSFSKSAILQRLWNVVAVSSQVLYKDSTLRLHTWRATLRNINMVIDILIVLAVAWYENFSPARGHIMLSLV